MFLFFPSRRNQGHITRSISASEGETSLLNQEEEIGAGERGRPISVGCLACCKHGARNISSIISSVITLTLGVWCHDPHFTDGDAESESSCSFRSPCYLSTRWQKMQFQNQFDLQTFRVPITWGFLEKSHQFFTIQLPLQVSQYCIPEQWLVSIVCHFLDDRVSFYVPCTMFCLVVNA